MLVAVTGVVLLGFIIGHLLGNLQIFLGPDWINSYAEHLRDICRAPARKNICKFPSRWPIMKPSNTTPVTATSHFPPIEERVKAAT